VIIAGYHRFVPLETAGNDHAPPWTNSSQGEKRRARMDDTGLAMKDEFQDTEGTYDDRI
jgi:hypothetical protein